MNKQRNSPFAPDIVVVGDAPDNLRFLGLRMPAPQGVISIVASLIVNIVDLSGIQLAVFLKSA